MHEWSGSLAFVNPVIEEAAVERGLELDLIAGTPSILLRNPGWFDPSVGGSAWLFVGLNGDA